MKRRSFFEHSGLRSSCECSIRNFSPLPSTNAGSLMCPLYCKHYRQLLQTWLRATTLRARATKTSPWISNGRFGTPKPCPQNADLICKLQLKHQAVSKKRASRNYFPNAMLVFHMHLQRHCLRMLCFLIVLEHNVCLEFPDGLWRPGESCHVSLGSGRGLSSPWSGREVARVEDHDFCSGFAKAISGHQL